MQKPCFARLGGLKKHYSKINNKKINNKNYDLFFIQALLYNRIKITSFVVIFHNIENLFDRINDKNEICHSTLNLT